MMKYYNYKWIKVSLERKLYFWGNLYKSVNLYKKKYSYWYNDFSLPKHLCFIKKILPLRKENDTWKENKEQNKKTKIS